MPDPRQVRSMFARIAGRYDFLNRLLSMGIDRRWRRELIGLSGDLRGLTVLDVCCGTGEVALRLSRGGARVVGIDFTPEMLRLAEQKRGRRTLPQAGPLIFVHGDAIALPVAAGGADLVTIAFGIRNVVDRAAGLAEMARALKPGARLLILEFGAPSNARMAAAFGLYFERILPRVGAFVSGDREAYRYLPESVAAWPGPVEFQREIEQAGFVDCGHRALSGGIAYLHWGSAPRARRSDAAAASRGAGV
jgi:demethylmenaquinone methyltransferase/2-methoxy-6-polyprenyl-1,4-benzoquinol methylase